MCGINGIFAYHYAANPVDRAELVRTRDHMIARGPDGAGLWNSDDHRVGFGHRRLSIIDLSDAGAQPMATADGRLVVTFNGEIYNHQDLRRDLEAKGYLFRSQCDTEVLLHLYADKGAGMVHDLRGMFAFAIWDARRGELFLARDPYGIKPLYYADDGWTFRFASQVKALLAGGAISRDPEPAGLVGFYMFGSVPDPFTTLAAVRSVPAGMTVTVDRIGARPPVRYDAIGSAYVATQRNGRQALSPPPLDRLRAALLDSVRSHLVSDVPVGAFLSAGVDSGALVGLMRDAGAKDIKTVTIGFEEFAGRPQDETVLSRAVADLYQTEHTTRTVTSAEFKEDLPRIMDAMDQPSIDGINTWFVSKAAREIGLKVAISGLGGDELLGGYQSFRDVPRWVRMVSVPSRVPFLGRMVRSIGARLSSAMGLHPKAAGVLEFGGTMPGAYLLKRGLFMPWELRSVLPRDVVVAGLRRLDPLGLISVELPAADTTPFASVAAMESALYMRNQLLRDTDWASMAHSIEVRVPLVDRVLLSEVGRLPGDVLEKSGKSMLGAAPRLPLPASVVHKSKTGFMTPVEQWVGQHAGRQRRYSLGTWARDWSAEVAGYASASIPRATA